MKTPEQIPDRDTPPSREEVRKQYETGQITADTYSRLLATILPRKEAPKKAS